MLLAEFWERWRRLWVFVEALNAREENARRIRGGAAAVAICMCAACVLGGYWYLTAYPAEKAIILKGPWPSAHNVFMETKEHLFFAMLILALISSDRRGGPTPRQCEGPENGPVRRFIDRSERHGD